MDTFVNECMECIYEGKDLLFTFREEAEKFANQQKLNIEYIEADFSDEQHYQIKGYKSKLYWIA